MNEVFLKESLKLIDNLTDDELEAGLKKAGLVVTRKLNASDQAIEYDKGWELGQKSIKLWEANFKEEELSKLVAAALSLFFVSVEQLDPHSRGIYDCFTQWQKSGESQMIKIACVVIVIDPLTGNVLAATRRGSTDDWGFIGGKTDGEAPLTAAFREFEEETGERLIAVPDYLGKFKDEEDWDIHVYMVTDPIEARMICDQFRSGHREVEAGIQVGLVPYSELMVKTFARFNIDLIPYIFKAIFQ